MVTEDGARCTTEDRHSKRRFPGFDHGNHFKKSFVVERNGTSRANSQVLKHLLHITMGCRQSKQQNAVTTGQGSSPKPATAAFKPLPPLSPVLSATERQQMQATLEQQFKVDLRFLPHILSAKNVMHRKLLEARQRLSERDEQSDKNNGNKNNDDSAATTKKPARPLRISFVQYAEQQAEQPTREQRIFAGIELLSQRMRHLHLQQVVMRDDGNCQFRSLAHQLFGNEDRYHAAVRAKIVDYLQQHASDYNFYFESESEWKRYLKTMAQSGTWGDEMTLTAAASVFGCAVHVLTSEQENYYLCYHPNNNDKGESKKDATACPDVFLAYISPIHYNSVVLVKT